MYQDEDGCKVVSAEDSRIRELSHAATTRETQRWIHGFEVGFQAAQKKAIADIKKSRVITLSVAKD